MRKLISIAAFSICIFSVVQPASAQGELSDPPVCTSREKDFENGATPTQPPQCSAPLIGGIHPELRVNLVAASRPVTISRFGLNGAAVENFRVSGAYTYVEDPAHPGDGSLLSPVLRPNIGDTLKLHLENELPDITDPHVGAVGPQVTNWHTHGMIVSPKAHGDNVFVLVYPKSAPSAPPMKDVIVTKGAFDYSIKIPANMIQMPGGNPMQSRAGLFWYHPHPHGISQQQLARGLSGFIAAGAVGDYADCYDATGAVISCDAIKRHFLMLRDFTLQKSGAGWDVASRVAGNGKYCTADANGDCADDANKKWLFTVNGAVKPVLSMTPGETQLIRLGNMGADVTYKLDLASLGGGGPLPRVQLIAKDGIAVADASPLPMLLMPAARAEFMISAPAAGGRFVLRTVGHNTGGDEWPLADLLEIDATGPAVAGTTPQVTVAPTPTAAPAGASATNLLLRKNAVAAGVPAIVPKAPMTPLALTAAPLLPEADKQTSEPLQGAQSQHHAAKAQKGDLCAHAQLKPGERRRITLDQHKTDPHFWVSYQIVDAAGHIVKTLFKNREFAMGQPDVCVKHGGEEIWEIVNNAPEIHNFHIHQVKFMVGEVKWKQAATDCNFVNLKPGAGNACLTTGVAGAGGHDTFPVPPNGGGITIAIPFKNTAQIGRFVFHCHLLEHEDHGMMSALTIIP